MGAVFDAWDGRPPGWLADGECADSDGDVFFSEDPGAQAVALTLCRRCRVVDQCRRFALGHPDIEGIWGGLTDVDRALLADPWILVAAVADAVWEPGLARNLTVARERAGQWARVASWPDVAAAAIAVQSILSGRAAVPAGRWQFVGSVVDDRSVLHARYWGPVPGDGDAVAVLVGEEGSGAGSAAAAVS